MVVELVVEGWLGQRLEVAAEVARQRLRHPLIVLGDRLPLVLLPHSKLGPCNPLRIATLKKQNKNVDFKKLHSILGFAHLFVAIIHRKVPDSVATSLVLRLCTLFDQAFQFCTLWHQ